MTKRIEGPDVMCPHCNHTLSLNSACATNSHIRRDGGPHPGMFGMCISCTELFAFDDALQLRRLKPVEEFHLRATESWSHIEEARRFIAAQKARIMGELVAKN